MADEILKRHIKHPVLSVGVRQTLTQGQGPGLMQGGSDQGIA